MKALNPGWHGARGNKRIEVRDRVAQIVTLERAVGIHVCEAGGGRVRPDDGVDLQDQRVDPGHVRGQEGVEEEACPAWGPLDRGKEPRIAEHEDLRARARYQRSLDCFVESGQLET